MSLNLGQEPIILIFLTLFEIFFIVIPALIAKFPDKCSFKDELLEMGFTKSQQNIRKQTYKILVGFSIGVIFLLIADYLIIFFKYIITENLFSSEFLQKAEEGAIDTTPVSPNMLEMLIILILQMVIIAPCEEGFFRGFIAKRFYKKNQRIIAVFLSSFCFAIYHVPPFFVPFQTIFTYFGYYFIFGMILVSFYKLFDYSLIPVVVAHATFNICLFLF